MNAMPGRRSALAVLSVSSSASAKPSGERHHYQTSGENGCGLATRHGLMSWGASPYTTNLLEIAQVPGTAIKFQQRCNAEKTASYFSIGFGLT
jgi:hypothetical protein